SLVMKAPQIVNGCQTAKTLGDFYKHKTNKELSALESNGHLLVKVIKTKRSAEESQKKELRDNITRYTNSQNAVRGLDFYALDRFQNG
ncbi:AIPR family protein, partial [Paenibacillus amylolyticus]